MTQPSLLWFLSSKFSLVVEDLLVFSAVLLYFVAGRRVEETLTRQACVLALALGSVYLRPVVETLVSFSFGASATHTVHKDILRGRLSKAPFRVYADSGLTVGICLFPLLFVPVDAKDYVVVSLLFAVCVANGVLILVSIANGNYDDLYRTPRVFVLREMILSCLLSVLCCWILLPSMDTRTLVLVSTASCLFPIFMRICIYCLQGSFSMAEAIIISESSVSFLVYCSFIFLQSSNNGTVTSESVYAMHQMSCAVILATVLFFFGYSYLFTLFDCRWRGNHLVVEQHQKSGYSVLNTCYFTGYLLIVLAFCYFWLTTFVSNPEQIILRYFFTSWSAIWLSVYWIILLCFVLFLIPPHRLLLAPIVARKYYHIVLFVILLPSLFIEAAFVSLCSIIALFLLTTIELGRASHVYGIRWLVNDYMSSLIDHRDDGTIYMTHLYLLLGSCFSLWQNPACSLLGMSGMVTLGVVDTVTASLGTFYGRRKWPGTCKTMEGTFSGMFLGILCCYLLYFYCNQCSMEPKKDTYVLFILTSSYLLSTMLEAFTTQIDNLVVPLYHYVILRQLIIIGS